MPKPPTWILLVHHLPPRPVRLRVRVWRQLQKLGAVTVKNSVYVLPWSDRTLEDFTWLQQEIVAGGGEAVLFRAGSLAGGTDSEIIAAFRRDRDSAYGRLTAQLRDLSRRLAGRREEPPRGLAEAGSLETEVERMQSELDRITEIDFYRAEGREAATAALDRCRGLLQSSRTSLKTPRGRTGSLPLPRDIARYQGRLWVTRPRPGIDRCASAWLIRRFVDKRPRFGFAADAGGIRRGIPFDMEGAAFSHRGEDCTFETLVKHFGLRRDAALRAIGQIVHDIDLKDGKFGRTEAAGVSAVMRGLAEGVRDDHRLLREAGRIFDGLYARIPTSPSRRPKGAPGKRG